MENSDTQFDFLFCGSRMEKILKKDKTISKVEARAIFSYMKENRPIRIMEFGVRYGCSTAAFKEMSKWIGYGIILDSWDLVDKVKYQDKKTFSLHLEDISGRECEILDQYKPDMVFLDAHPYKLTKNLMQGCLDKKIDFMAHDISLPLLERVRKESNGFKNKDVYTPWEAYLIGELISEDLWSKDTFENGDISAVCTRDLYGLIVVKHKR